MVCAKGVGVCVDFGVPVLRETERLGCGGSEGCVKNDCCCGSCCCKYCA